MNSFISTETSTLIPGKIKIISKALQMVRQMPPLLSIVIMFSLPQYEKTRNILMIVFFLQTAKTNLNCAISVDESLHKVFSVSVFQ